MTKWLILAVLLVLSSFAYATDFTTDLQLHIDMDGALADDSGNGLSVTNGGTSYTTGYQGQGTLFNSAENDDIQVGTNNAIDGMAELTLAMWIKPDSKSVSHRVMHMNGVYSFTLDHGEDEMRLRVYNETTTTELNPAGSSTITYGAWQWVVATYDGATGNFTIYNNATKTDSQILSLTGNVKDGAIDLSIGIDEDGTTIEYDGDMDEASIWDRVLTQAEVTELFNAYDAGSNPINYSSGGDNYYVCPNGSDANTGLSPAQAYKTITQVNTLSLNPGDNVSFCRGGYWWSEHDAFLSTDNGDATGYITYNAYGTGALPVIDGGVNVSSSDAWTDLGSNIWVMNETQNADTAVFANNGDYTVKEDVYADLNAQGEFWYNSSNDLTYMYSTSNPGTYYDSIYIGKERTIITGGGASPQYNIFEHLDIRHGGSFGINYGDASHMIIRNCSISFIGGTYQSGTTKYGNAIQFIGSSDDTYIGYNNLSWAYDACLTHQEPDDGTGDTLSNHVIEYNIFDRCFYGYEFFNSINDAGAVTANITINHNTFVYTGNGLYESRSYNKALRMARSPTATSNVTATNNIIYQSKTLDIDVGAGSSSNWKGTDFSSDYNLFNNMYVYHDGHYYSSPATYFIAENSEGNGIEQDPKLDSYFIPAANSPACSAASDGGDIGALSCGTNYSGEYTDFSIDFTSTVDMNNNILSNNSAYSMTETGHFVLYLNNTGGFTPSSFNCTSFVNLSCNPIGNDTWNMSSNTSRNVYINNDCDQFFYVYATCEFDDGTVYGSATTPYYEMYADDTPPVATITNEMPIQSATELQYTIVNASCYDFTLENATISIRNSTGGWYYSDNQTGLFPGTQTYNWNVNISIVGWPLDNYTIYVNCSEEPVYITTTSARANVLNSNVTIYLNDTNTATLIENFTASVNGTGYNAVGNSTTIWLTPYINYVMTANISYYTVTPTNYYPNTATNNLYFVAGGTDLNITVYDEGLNVLLDWRNVTIEIIGGNTYNHTTDSGQQSFLNVVPGYYEIVYYADDYYRRSYYATIENTATTRNIVLYLLNSSEGTRVFHTLYDENSNKLEDITVRLLRYYSASNSYKTVQMAKTNFEGRAQLYVELYNTYYKLQYTDGNGTTYKITNTTYWFDTETEDSVKLSEDEFQSWRQFDDGYYNLTWINNSGTIYARFIYSVTSGTVRTGCLNVQRVTTTGIYDICNNCTTSSSAVLTCTIDTSLTGEYKAIGYIDTNTENSWYTTAVSWYRAIDASAIPNDQSVFMVAIIVGTIAITGFASVTGSIFLFVVALIISSAIGLAYGIGWQVMAYLAISGFMVVFIFNRVKS